MTPTQIILKPILTEKGTMLQETGGRDYTPVDDDYPHKYAFEVAVNANKIEIKSAIEKLFEVQVRDVRTMVVRGKRQSMRTRRGMISGQRKKTKKAIVTLVAGETIELFEGV